MRQQNSAIESTFTGVSLNEENAETFQMIMADSVEVMEYYYRGKIQELEQSLARLTILEDAREVSCLCKDIMRTKEMLYKIIRKKGARCSIQISVK
jgi:hypothetical protein